MKIKGIYKIVSPSGGVYIGQSVEMQDRWRFYRRMHAKGQVKLYNSFLKYGVENHEFSIVHQLPSDVTSEVLDVYEQIYIDQYRATNHKMLNLKDAGSNGKCSEETKRKMSLSKKGKPTWNKGIPASAETRKKQSEARRKRTEFSPITRQRISEALKGRKRSKEHSEKIAAASRGRKHTLEARMKMSVSRKGKPLPKSPEHCKKISEAKKGKPVSPQEKVRLITMLKNMVRKPHSEATKEKLRQAALKQTHLPCSEKQKQQISAANKGRIRTPEMREKVSRGLKLYFQKLRENALPQ
jgi:group I intron endonuclease